MSQPVGLGIPLSSNNRANINTALSGGGGNTIAGVQSLNAQAGNLTLLGDASIDVTNLGSGQLQFSTSGNAQNFAAVSCTTLAASGSVTAGGAVSGATVAATGALSGANLTTSGAAAIGGQVQAASLFVSGGSSLVGPATINAAGAWGAAITSGSQTIAGTIANGATVNLGALNGLLASPGYNAFSRVVTISCVAIPATPFAGAGVNMSAMYMFSVPAASTTTGQSSQSVAGGTQVLGSIINNPMSGPNGSRVINFSWQNVSGVASDASGLTYYWNIV